MKSAGREKRGFSLKKKLLSMAIIPTVILAVIITVYAAISMMDGMQREFLDGLRNLAGSVQAAYNALDSENYSLDEQGKLVKGKLNVTDEEELIDSFVAGTDVAVTIFYGDTRMATSLISDKDGKRIVGTKASEEVVQTVIGQGKEYEATNLTINEKDYYAYYIPAKNMNGEIVGMYFAGAPSAEINQYIMEKVRNIVLLCLFITIMIVLVVIFISGKITGAILATEEVLTELSRGNLKISVGQKELKRTDEIGIMARALQQTVDKLSGIITHISASAVTLMEEGTQLESMASQTSHTTDEVGRAVEEISKGAITQAEEIENATHLISNMGEQIEQIVAAISILYQISEEMQNAGKQALGNMDQLSGSNEHTNEAIEKVAENVEKTDKSVAVIAEALDMITDIADETNLLSLNASIEAARAGEAGRGFAVVAGQIQKLAEESNESASQIAQIITTLSADSANTLSVMKELMENITVQQEKLADTAKRFHEVNKGIVSSNQSTEQIHKQASDCDTSRVSVVDIIQNLSALSEENAASTQETTASMQELNANINLLADSAKGLQGLAESLKSDMEFFQV